MHLFKVGDMVVVPKKSEDFFFSLAGNRGLQNKPRRVVAVIPVPTKCDCGVMEGYPHHESCGVNNVKHVGHRQWLSVEDLGSHISASWFEPAPAQKIQVVKPAVPREEIARRDNDSH